MSSEFPSIWMELQRSNEQNILISGCYREWTNEGLLSVEEQVKAVKILTSQMEKADSEKKPIIMLGDMNLCAKKWNDADFNKKV